MAFLLFLLVLGPITAILLLAWLGTKKKIFGQIVGSLWLGIFGLLFIGYIVRMLTDKKVLDHEDYYGEYIIDRDFFAGKQADWQYNNFRFEIKENDSIYFYVTNKAKILSTYKGKIITKSPFGSARLRVFMKNHTHHILAETPTTYRSAWNFYLVFNSSKFNNVYFKKGTWEPIKK